MEKRKKRQQTFSRSNCLTVLLSSHSSPHTRSEQLSPVLLSSTLSLFLQQSAEPALPPTPSLIPPPRLRLYPGHLLSSSRSSGTWSTMLIRRLSMFHSLPPSLSLVRSHRYRGPSARSCKGRPTLASLLSGWLAHLPDLDPYSQLAAMRVQWCAPSHTHHVC